MLIQPLRLLYLKLKSVDAHLELALKREHLGLVTTALVVKEASVIRIKVSEPALELIALVFKRHPCDVLRQLASADGGFRKAVGIMPPVLPLVQGGREIHLVPPLTIGEFDVRVLTTVVAIDGSLSTHDFVASIEESPFQGLYAGHVGGGRLGACR